VSKSHRHKLNYPRSTCILIRTHTMQCEASNPAIPASSPLPKQGTHVDKQPENLIIDLIIKGEVGKVRPAYTSLLEYMYRTYASTHPNDAFWFHRDLDRRVDRCWIVAAERGCISALDVLQAADDRTRSSVDHPLLAVSIKQEQLCQTYPRSTVNWILANCLKDKNLIGWTFSYLMQMIKCSNAVALDWFHGVYVVNGDGIPTERFLDIIKLGDTGVNNTFIQGIKSDARLLRWAKKKTWTPLIQGEFCNLLTRSL
jgi:hypothetical protein